MTIIFCQKIILNNFEFNGEEIRGVSLVVKFRIFMNYARTLVTVYKI